MKHPAKLRTRFALPTAFVIAAGFLFIGTSKATASIYHFVETSSGEVLAALDLSALPATHAQVTSLTWTAAGSAIFGFPDTTYTGDFDFTTDFTSASPFVVSDLAGGLKGTGGNEFTLMIDFAPPATASFPLPDTLELGFGAGLGEDTIFLIAQNTGESKDSSGNWRLATPEPTGLIVWSMLMGVAAIGTARRRKQ